MGKVRFFLATEKGFKVLKAVSENLGTQFIESVICAPDPQMKEDYYKQITSYCEHHKITCRDRLDQINAPTVSFIIAISWKWIIKPLGNVQLIVFHDSLLPKYRGFNPLVSCLINGELEIGATAIFGSERYDEGDIINQRSCSITYPIKIHQAILKISQLYEDLALDICQKIAKNEKLQSYPQNKKIETYSLWRDELDYHIDWDQSSEKIERFIAAVGPPYLGAFSLVNGLKIRIFDARAYDDVDIVNRSPGKVIFMEKNHPVIVCGKGLLQIINMQDETGKTYLLNKFRVRFQ